MPSPLPTPTRPERISAIMRSLLDGSSREARVSVGHILQVFGVRGFALLLLVLSLLNIIIFFVPLISILFGLPMVILAVQMVLGFRAPIFPAVIRHQTIPGVALTKGLETAIRWVEKIERYIRPRFLFLAGPRVDRLHGVLALVMAVMVTIPLPFFNIPPSLGLAFLAIGMLQRDGIFILLAYAIGIWCLYLFKSLGVAVHSLG